MHVIWFAMQGKTSPTAAGAKAETCHICGNWQVRLERVIIVFMPFSASTLVPDIPQRFYSHHLYGFPM